MWENEATSMEPFQQYLAETFPEDSWPSSLQAEWTDYKLVKQLTDRQNSLQASWTGQSSWTGYKSSTLYSLPTRKPSYFHVWLHTYQCRASACGWNSKDITRAKFRGPWSAVYWRNWKLLAAVEWSFKQPLLHSCSTREGDWWKWPLTLWH